MILKVKNKETLIIDEFRFKCSIGKNGFKKKNTKETEALQLVYLE